MDNDDSVRRLFDELIALLEKYSVTYRGNINSARYQKAINSGIVSEEDYGNPFVRETLAEHVGYLPIIASYLYPYLENKSEVDLGRVLIMLAFHDIGETVTGDIISYHKNDEHAESENRIAKRMLHEDYVETFNEFNECNTYDAKFANSIDMIAPLLIDYIDLSLNMKRWKHHSFSLQDVIDKKRNLMVWDALMLSLFDIWVEDVKKLSENDLNPVEK